MPQPPKSLSDCMTSQNEKSPSLDKSKLGPLFSRNSDYEEVEGEKHPPVIQPVAPLIVKPEITNHLLSNACLSRPEPCRLNPLRTTEPHSCRVSTNDSLILTISQYGATPVWRDLSLQQPTQRNTRVRPEFLLPDDDPRRRSTEHQALGISRTDVDGRCPGTAESSHSCRECGRDFP